MYGYGSLFGYRKRKSTGTSSDVWPDTTAKVETYALSDAQSWADTLSGGVLINYMFGLT